MKNLNPKKKHTFKNNFLIGWILNLPVSGKLYLMIGIMSITTVSVFLIGKFGMETLSSIRALIGGESLYSKAQKDAVYFLLKYADSRDEKDYQEFQQFIKVPAGDKKLRLELEKPNPDLDVALQGFIEGRNSAKDFKGVVYMYRKFRKFKYVEKAISIWTEADSLIDELKDLGAELHDRVTSGNPSQEQLDAICGKIIEVNKKLQPLEENFSYTLGDAARWAKDFLARVILIICGIVFAIGILTALFIGRIISTRIKKVVGMSAKYANGNFDAKLEVTSADEIGNLFGSLNRMADNLKRLNQETMLSNQQLEKNNHQLIENEQQLKALAVNLEQKIKERTKELEEEKDSLETKVQARTKELRAAKTGLEEKLREITNMNEIVVGRELMVLRLRAEINGLCKELGGLVRIVVKRRRGSDLPPKKWTL